MSQLKSSEMFAAHPQGGQFTAQSLEHVITCSGTNVLKTRGDGWLYPFADKGNCLFLYKLKVKISLPVKMPICKLLWDRFRGHLLTWLQR